MKWAAALTVLLAVGGCVAKQAPIPESLPEILEVVSIGEKGWTVFTHTSGSVAIRVVIEALTPTMCSFLFAAHVTGEDISTPGLVSAIESKDDLVHTWGAHDGNLLSWRAHVLAVDSKPVLDQTLAQAGMADSDVRREVSNVGIKGEYNVSAWAPSALDGGPGDTHGGSLAISGDCNDPVTVREFVEDADPTWITRYTDQGTVDVMAFTPGLNVGSVSAKTENTTVIEISAGGLGHAKIDISGPVIATFEKAPAVPTSSDWWSWQSWSGPPGEYAVNWVAAQAFASFEIRVLSFVALPEENLVWDPPHPP